jgi:O-antigen/teichoic acid export membrane protein
MGNSSAGNFIKNVAITSTSNILLLFFGVITSIILARSLGPKNRGVYALINMLPMLIITFSNLGIGKATTYYVSKGLYHKSEVIGNNILLTILIGTFGICIGFIVILFFQQSIFPNVPTGYLLFALILIPLQFLITNIQYFFLGLNEIKIYNIVFIIKAIIFLILIFIIVKELRLGVIGALAGTILSSLLALVISLYWAQRIAGGISYKINNSYCKKVVKYGIQIHLGTIIAFLNYRIDIFLINIILGPTQVGFYTICVGLVEKLSIVSHTVSALLFPKIAGENDVQRRKKITPIITRNMFWIVSFAAIVLFFLCRWIIVILYTEAYLPSVRPLDS